MKILVACEFSGIVRDAFRKRGHDAWSCDILPTEADPTYHLQCDVLEILDQGWDMMIAHPPCIYLANSGVRWLYANPRRWEKLKEAAEFFKALWNANIPRIALENPIPHKYARDLIGVPYSQVIQPWQFGHGETKATCLWLKNLPPLKPTNIVDGRENRVHRMPPGPNRWRERSRTFHGIAEAMAAQWG